MVRRSSPLKAKRAQTRPVFDSIRKPGAPPGHPIARAKPDEVARPAQRKAKHKRRPDTSGEEDI
jgi:hypothetical protein